MKVKMRNFPSPELEDSPTSAVAVKLLWSVSKWEIVGCGAWLSSFCLEVFVLAGFGPHTPTGGCGGITPHYIYRRVQGGR